MDFKQLRAFMTVADTGNVTRAAELLNLVQPAVSRQVRLLEEDIGAELFERQRKGMVLTSAGKSLLAYARRAMLELDRARAEIGGATDGVSGIATIGLLPSTADIVASALVRSIADAYPGIRMRIATGYAGTLQQWIETGEIDAALLYDAERVPTISSIPLVEEDLWIVGPVSAKLRSNKPVALRSLVGQPLILPSGPKGIRTLVDHACAVAGVELTVVAETNAMNVQKSLVLGGHGLTVLPPIAVADELSQKLLSAAPLSEPTIKRTIVLALPANREVGPHVRCVVDLMCERVHLAVDQGAWPQARWIGS